MEDELVYIGLDISRGGGIYPDRGLSRRLMSHVVRKAPADNDVNVILCEKRKNIGVTLDTIGVTRDKNYLAPALEDFLIGQFNPSENQNKRKNS